MSSELATENETTMKAKKQVSEGTPFNDDDQRKRIMDYDLRLYTWNSWTLNWDSSSAKLAETLTECGADITAIQEMRWIGQEFKIQKNCNIGSGFEVVQSLRHLVLGFTPVNERLAEIRIKAKFHNISLICAHAPTEE